MTARRRPRAPRQSPRCKQQAGSPPARFLPPANRRPGAARL